MFFFVVEENPNDQALSDSRTVKLEATQYIMTAEGRVI